MILGFDPGRDKCGVAVMSPTNHPTDPPHIAYADVVPADEAIATVLSLIKQYPIATLVMGDQTMSKTWKSRLEEHLAPNLSRKPILQEHAPNQPSSYPAGRMPMVMIDERYSTLEARDRYWQLHPPSGLIKFVPQALRTIPRPIDDVVAIILIERYWRTLDPPPNEVSVSALSENTPT